MILGYNEATCEENSDIENDIILCSRYGYTAIELRLDMVIDYLEYHTITELKALLIKNQLTPYALNSIENVNFCTPKDWKNVESLFLLSCDIAKELEIPYIVIMPTMTSSWNTKTEEEVSIDSIQALNKLADISESIGVKLAFEPVGDRRWCCNSLRHAIEIIQSINRESVGLALDCINFYMHDKCADLASIRNIPKGKLFVFHINDCEDLPLGRLDHCHRIMPGQGCIPLKDILSAVKDIGYTGPALLELFRPEYWDMEPSEVISLGAKCCIPYL